MHSILIEACKYKLDNIKQSILICSIKKIKKSLPNDKYILLENHIQTFMINSTNGNIDKKALEELIARTEGLKGAHKEDAVIKIKLWAELMQEIYNINIINFYMEGFITGIKLSKKAIEPPSDIAPEKDFVNHEFNSEDAIYRLWEQIYKKYAISKTSLINIRTEDICYSKIDVFFETCDCKNIIDVKKWRKEGLKDGFIYLTPDDNEN